MLNQKRDTDCFVACLFYATGIKYKTIKKYCGKYAGYSTSRKRGTSSTGITKVLSKLNIKYRIPKDGKYRNINSITKGDPCIYTIIFKGTNEGHAIYWNGRRFIDPSNRINKPYKEHQVHTYYPDIESAGMVYILPKYSLIRRLFNLITA